jgi:hypothetical protein
MAGFTGNPRKLGSAGIPPSLPPPVVTETTSVGTDTFYLLGIALAEDINPNGSGYPPVRATMTASPGTDTYYILEVVLSESLTMGPTAGTFRITETGSAGSDTYYALAIILSE